MSIRTETIHRALARWLERYSPPMAIKDNMQAMQDETEALLRALLKFAPREGYDGWVAEALERCAYQMKTRAWPTVGELGAVCSNMRKERIGDAAPADEASTVDRMGDWFRRFGNEMPGFGRFDRTEEMIRRGHIANLREARWRGFALSEEQRRIALSQPIGREEWRHHCTVMARIHGITFEEAEAMERVRSRPDHALAAPKRMPRTQDWEAAE